MLTLQLSEDQAAALEMAKRLAREVLRPAAGQASTDRCVPAAVWRTFRDSGLVVPIDAAYGGGGFPDACLLGLSVEALAYGDPAIATVAAWYGNAALVVGASGSAEQQQSYLTRLATGTGGEIALALYEGYGRLPEEYETVFLDRGDGTIGVTGQKTFVPVIAGDGVFVVIGRDASTGRLHAVLIPADSPRDQCHTLRRAARPSRGAHRHGRPRHGRRGGVAARRA